MGSHYVYMHMMVAILIFIISISIVAPLLWSKKYLSLFSIVNGVLWLVIEFVLEFTAKQPDLDVIFIFGVLFKSVIVAALTLLFMHILCKFEPTHAISTWRTCSYKSIGRVYSRKAPPCSETKML